MLVVGFIWTICQTQKKSSWVMLKNTEVKNDPMVIKSKFESAKNCMDSIIAIFTNWNNSKKF